MDAEAVKPIMISHGLIELFRLHPELTNFGDKASKTTTSLLVMLELYILPPEQMSPFTQESTQPLAVFNSSSHHLI